MNILLVSECSKKALVESRRILDQFAPRTGERTWLTNMTAEGLKTLRQMLKKNARKNTAVACHWLKKNGQNELLWIVGNRRCFNADGAVPTNSTHRDLINAHLEHGCQQQNAIALLAALGALFHDFGKSFSLFQQKLRGDRNTLSEPYRHEWLSAYCFKAFVHWALGLADESKWLNKLHELAKKKALTADEEKDWLKVLRRFLKENHRTKGNPTNGLPPLAKTVCWLILSHHRLPAPTERMEDYKPISSQKFDGRWISSQCDESSNNRKKFSEKEWGNLWLLEEGKHSPLMSTTWCKKAAEIAHRILKQENLCQQITTNEWFDNRFGLHLARLSLMFADHFYSAGAATTAWQDQNYAAYANTAKDKLGKRQCKQKLDEHCIGVAHHAYLIARRLPLLPASLPSIGRCKLMQERTTHSRFLWQNHAFDLARGIAEQSRRQGFFGLNMASTGCGKTLANARIMYGLGGENSRFAIALGLRTLTLQTGQALRERLELDEEDIAVLIGSQAVQRLFTLSQDEDAALNQTGSESLEDLLDHHKTLHYEGSLEDGALSQWMGANPKLRQLISAPILVSTIDHLMPACESTRGGHQIAPILRLLTSDLVLDEPDDFGLQDLPALCRLVNWAGVFGSRVLLSSATLPPDLVCTLFAAYRAGREQFAQAFSSNGAVENAATGICCAWFDENSTAQQPPQYQEISDKTAYQTAHENFVNKRIEALNKQAESTLRTAQICPVDQPSDNSADAAVKALSTAIQCGINQLHETHGITPPAPTTPEQSNCPDKKISLGLVRFANINPLVAVAQQLMQCTPPEDTVWHLCIYHSHFPLLLRSEIEKRLDGILQRGDENKFWQRPEIKAALKDKRKNHVFIVLATAVAEVGRDHDYDWGIVEPSSMRSIIQLAGRIGRHRKDHLPVGDPEKPRLLLLSKNFKALQETQSETEEPTNPVYCRPGFEDKQNRLKKHNLSANLEEEQYRYINANPRIQRRDAKVFAPNINLVDLEQQQTANTMKKAEPWWEESLHWSGQMQDNTRFRQSQPEEVFYLLPENDDEDSDITFHREDYSAGKRSYKSTGKASFEQVDLPANSNGFVQPWFNLSFAELAKQQAESEKRALQSICALYGELRLDAPRGTDTRKWQYNELLGAFHKL